VGVAREASVARADVAVGSCVAAGCFRLRGMAGSSSRWKGLWLGQSSDTESWLASLVMQSWLEWLMFDCGCC